MRTALLDLHQLGGVEHHHLLVHELRDLCLAFLLHLVVAGLVEHFPERLGDAHDIIDRQRVAISA